MFDQPQAAYADDARRRRPTPRRGQARREHSAYGDVTLGTVWAMCEPGLPSAVERTTGRERERGRQGSNLRPRDYEPDLAGDDRSRRVTFPQVRCPAVLLVVPPRSGLTSLVCQQSASIERRYASIVDSRSPTTSTLPTLPPIAQEHVHLFRTWSSEQRDQTHASGVAIEEASAWSRHRTES